MVDWLPDQIAAFPVPANDGPEIPAGPLKINLHPAKQTE